MASIGPSLTLMTVILAAALTADAQDIAVGFEESAYNIDEGESLEICVAIFSPDDIESTRVFLEVVPDEDAAENTATPDEVDPLFGSPLMVDGADYLPPLEHGTDQILNMPLTQSARSVCYTQETYQDEDAESDETFTIKIIPDPRPENMLDNLVIDEERGSVQVTIIDDDDGIAPTNGIITMCPQVDSPENGQVNVTDFDIGAMAIYTCNSGYQVNGSDVLTCGNDGQWSPNPPTCTLLVCDRLEAPENGQVMYSGDSGLGEVANFDCNTGYMLEGHDNVTCGTDYQWSNSPPNCTFIVCDRLEAPENGQVIYSGDSGVGEVANFDCNTGYMLEGHDNVTCGADYQWSASPPTCTLIVCDRLEDPENGEVTYSGDRRVGDMASFECNPGYKLQGTSPLFCLETGEWDGPTDPTCGLDVAIQFNPNTYTVTEGTDEFVELIIQIEKEHNEVLVVNVSLLQQSAEAGSDYVATTTEVAFSPGQREDTIKVIIIDDSTAEETEIFTAILSTGDMDTPAMATVIILDNDEEEKASESGAVTSYTGIIITVSAVVALLLIAAIIFITVLIIIFKHRRKRQKKVPSPEPALGGPYCSLILDKTNQIKTPEVELQTEENEADDAPPPEAQSSAGVEV